MGAIAELVKAEPTTTLCRYAELLETLDDTDRQIVEDASYRRAAALLRAVGHGIGSTSIGDHRRGECACI